MRPLTEKLRTMVAQKKYKKAAKKIVRYCVRNTHKGVEVLPSLKLLYEQTPEWSAAVQDEVAKLKGEQYEKAHTAFSFGDWFHQKTPRR